MSITKMLIDGCMLVARVRVVVMSIIAFSAGRSSIVAGGTPASWHAATAWRQMAELGGHLDATWGRLEATGSGWRPLARQAHRKRGPRARRPRARSGPAELFHQLLCHRQAIA